MKEIPCKDCITLAICQGRLDDAGTTGTLVYLARKCSLLEAHLQMYDIRPKQILTLNSRQAGKTYEADMLTEIQGQRIINLVKFMGWQLREGDSDETKEEEKKKLRQQTEIPR